jgi:uncharacterized protein
MIRRILVVATLVLGTITACFAIGLFFAPDSMELLAGFVAGSLRRLQAGALAVAAILVAASFAAERTPPRTCQLARLIVGAAVGIAAVVLLTRDRLTFRRETVTFTAAGLRFAGTLYHPRAVAPPRPAILLLHGSGPVRRETYDMFARRFTALGFLVFNVDKRGVGGSSGNYYGDDLSRDVIERRAADARAALAYLVKRPDVDSARIGLFSISQGGWVVSMLAGGDTPARFAVNFSGPAVSSFEEGRWSKWTDENNDHFGMKPPPVPFEELDQRIRSVAPGHFNPRPHLAHAAIPTLWLFGEWDSSQPALASVRVLDSLTARGLPVTSRVFAHANHGLMIARGPGGKRFPDFAPGVWDSVSVWLTREVRHPGRE